MNKKKARHNKCTSCLKGLLKKFDATLYFQFTTEIFKPLSDQDG